MRVIDARHIRHSYVFGNRRVPSLRDVCLQAEAGEFVAIVGCNGCGKSTFAKHLNVLVELQHGELTVAELSAADPANTWEIRRHCGMVFQNPDNQFVSSVVREDLLFGLQNFGIPADEHESRMQRALELVEMPGCEKRNPHQLSGGQKQRIALAGVLALEPDIVVLDEATTMLPPHARAEVLRVVRSLRGKTGATVLMITHYIEEAVTADRVVVMAEGSVLAQGTPRDVLADADLLRRAGLEPPLAARLWHDLSAADAQVEAQAGAQVEAECPLTLEEAADWLARKRRARQSARTVHGDDGASPSAEPAADSIVSLESVTFAYDPSQQPALDDVSLRVRAGEFVGIVGRTGCGKSTLVQLIAGLLEPTAGMVRLDGSDINARGYDRSLLRRRIGMVFQYPEMQLFEQTVEKDVAFGLRQLGLSRAERAERIGWALREMGFDAQAVSGKSPLGLSGGEKRRVAIAGVLAVRPDVLILDEPVAGLDPAGRAAFMQLLDNLNARGTTIIMVSHNADCLAEHAGRVLVMDAGRIVRDGTPQEVYVDVPALHGLGVGVCQTRELAALLAARGMPVGAPVRYQDLIAALQQW